VSRPLEDDGTADVADYNAELKARGDPSWHAVEWLYAECYLYRRINAVCRRSRFWKDYDVFAAQKMSTFKSSRPAVAELAARYKDIVQQIGAKDSAHSGSTMSKDRAAAGVREAEKVMFTEMCEICLWGNATDLSLLTSLTYEDIQKLQGSEARKSSEKNILVNDLPAAFEVLMTAKEKKQVSRVVSIVLDNAGFELFADLFLAGYLLASGLASEVVLLPKSIPWFVSDVTPQDFADLLNALADPQTFYKSTADSSSDSPALTDDEVSNVRFLFDDWSRLHGEGRLVIRPNRFWTQAGSFWRMPHTATDVLDGLRQSELVIFKGDLNYRKLTGDVRHDHSHFSPLLSLSLSLSLSLPVASSPAIDTDPSDKPHLRPPGHRQRRSPPPSVRSARPPAGCAPSRCAPANPTWSSACPPVATKRSEPETRDREGLARESGLGTASSRSCSSAMGSCVSRKGRDKGPS
jgi:damage-control phosphatase, subfamily III